MMGNVIIVITQHPPHFNGLYDQSSIMMLNKCPNNSQIPNYPSSKLPKSVVRQNKDVPIDLGMSITFFGPTLLSVYH